MAQDFDGDDGRKGDGGVLLTDVVRPLRRSAPVETTVGREPDDDRDRPPPAPPGLEPARLALEPAIAATGAAAAAIVVDIDGFRLVGELLGGDVAARLLEQVEQRLVAWAGSDRTVVHLGDDRFAVVARIGADHQLLAMTEAVGSLFDRPFEINGSPGPLYVTVCMGMAVANHLPPTYASAQDVLGAAAEALREAKATGPGGASWFDTERHRVRAERFRLQNDLHGAAARGELVLAYQPIVEMASVRPVAVEALIRWQHPALGLLPPARFLPAAEAAGLMPELGGWVLRTACEQLAEWQVGMPSECVPSVCVNVASGQFEDPGFVDDVQRVLRVTGVDPTLLVLELNETTMLHDSQRVTHVLEQLRSCGINIAVDDFGSGHSSLAYLKRLPVSVVKVDRAFVADVATDPRDQAIVRAVIELAHALGVTTIIEGVEARDQLDALRELGCEYGQGYYWSMPVPPEEIVPWLTGRALSLARRQRSSSEPAAPPWRRPRGAHPSGGPGGSGPLTPVS